MKSEDRFFLAAHWSKCIVGPDMELHERESDGPTVCDGVYFLFDGPTLVYVGKSGYVKQRIQQHRTVWRPFTHWGAVAVPHPLLEAIEAAYINALRPIQNTSVPSLFEDVQHDIVKGIHAAWNFSAKKQLPSVEEAGNGKVYAEI